ncbi:metalloregulator ArsR/SmtB family transcription factor [Kribbella jejuensis]|uniref:ArsR family transcriptional regulator n=1 Tax=Kribbella jejuensis TaxID=236068 RepID=A0A542EWM4_9ACTN|nr:metalloregulator ArsR/SmtB family transcription factor [Kribbella jejuensis]TQJ19759.1 ArsR family transcriptional regulator [Kribbella jejuensis]
MSKQEIVLTPRATDGCCAPISTAALDPDGAAEGATVFKALADPIRLRLFSMITSAGDEICVCDLTPQFDVSGPTISHHLKVLREAGLVDCERRGTWVYYWPVPEKLQWISSLLAAPAIRA